MNFQIWQHLEQHWNKSQLQHLASIPSVPVGQLYSYMVTGIQHITLFFIWRVNRRYRLTLDTVFTYRSLCDGYRITYNSRFGNICCYFFWCWPVILVCWPLQPGATQYTIVDDDVEAAPIYRCDSKASQLLRPHENHGLHIECIPAWVESQCR